MKKIIIEGIYIQYTGKEYPYMATKVYGEMAEIEWLNDSPLNMFNAIEVINKRLDQYLDPVYTRHIIKSIKFE